MPTLSELQKRVAANDMRYNLHFAGLSRVTRDLATMDDMLATAQSVLSDLPGVKNVPGDEREALRAAAQRQVELYRGERTAIVDAQRQGGPTAVEASIQGTRANFVFHRYARHFANQSRSTRDLSLMVDMSSELQRIHAAMLALQARKSLPSLTADLEVVVGRLAQFQEERGHIAAAREGGTLAEQAGALAQTANGLFAAYRTHFAGQPRVTRRPELLVRLLEALQLVLERMQALQIQGLHDEENDANLDIVSQRLQGWRTELVAIRAERQKATLPSMVADLRTAVDADLEGYAQHFAGQSRKTRDLRRLTDICDRLDEIERQMTRLDEVKSDAALTSHLRIVRDALVLYQNEFDEITRVQGAG